MCIGGVPWIVVLSILLLLEWYSRGQKESFLFAFFVFLVKTVKQKSSLSLSLFFSQLPYSALFLFFG